MYVLDQGRFSEALRRKGFGSVAALARVAGLHRNTVQQFLRGRRAIAPTLERILDILELQPGNAIVRRREDSPHYQTVLAKLVDALSAQFRDLTFVLFGSRARGTARKYSDIDLGVYASRGIAHGEFRRVYQRVSELAEDLAYKVDCVNLCSADPDFLRQAALSWLFLAGRREDWLELQKKAGQ